MDFNFPDNKVLNYYGIIQNYLQKNNRFSYSNIDILDPKDNLLKIGSTDYFFTYLEGNKPGNKGGNSVLLKLYNSQYIDTDNPEYDEPDLILKMSKFRKSNKPQWKPKSEMRFDKEIESLSTCLKSKAQNVIKIFDSGICKIRNPETGKFDEYLYYTMEYAGYDLKNYVESNFYLMHMEEKIALCISLCQGLQELFMLGYYHRDIKPDNIFITDGIWKIGDLGLVDERNKAIEIDKVAEPIGPKGWMSPESMNKYLCEGKKFDFQHNCFIDHQSDIFQLGKVFWYIFQYNAPIGSIKEKDFLVKNSQIYAVIKTMLSYSKHRRYKNISEVAKLLKLIELQVLKTKIA